MTLNFSEIDPISGWLTLEEGHALYILARDTRNGVVEIGAYQGRSTACLASGIRDSRRPNRKVVSVDPHRGSAEHQIGERHFREDTLDSQGNVNTFPRFMENMTRLGLVDFVDPWLLTSTDAALRFDTYADLVFIDASHDYENVKNDASVWIETLTPRPGIMVFHDYGQQEGVTRVVDELVDLGRKVSIRIHSLIGIHV